MKPKEEQAGKAAEKETGTAVETPVKVWFVVTKHAAVIGDAHHAKGKRMQLPKNVADECVAQGLGKLDGVAV